MTGASSVGRLGEWMKTCNGNHCLRSLVVPIEMTNVADFLSKEEDWKCELDPLDDITGLERVDFRIEESKLGNERVLLQAGTGNKAYRAARYRLQVALTELAPAMVGRRNGACTIRTQEVPSMGINNASFGDRNFICRLQVEQGGAS